MSDAVSQYLQKGKEELQQFALTFAGLIAEMAVDPHGYFQMKYAARIEKAHSEQEIRGVLTQLVQWTTSSSVTDAEREKLDRELGERGMPSTADLRAHLLF
jgi:triphosphoribosyl-dephospho-CoA synthetase